MIHRLLATRGGLAAMLTLTTLLSLDVSPARADVVRSPPEDCPEGSFGGTSHCGPVCAADLCQTDADCENGEACETYALCTKPYCDGGIEVTGPCAAGCVEGATCTPLKVCVPPGTGTGGQGGTSTTGATSPTGVGGSSTTGAPPGAGGAAGAGAGGTTGVAGQGGNGTDLSVTGCSCHLPRSGAARDAAAVMASIAGLVGLALRSRRRRAGPR